MQVVMVYDVTDGYTFNSTETIPVEYSSVEQALVDFETGLKTTRETKAGNFVFAGLTFWSCDFYYNRTEYNLPEFLSVDEWFNKYGVNR